MLKKIKYSIALLLSISFSTAGALVVIAPEPQNANTVSRNEVDTLITRSAFKYAVSPSKMEKIIMCESSFKTTAKKITSKESSYGLVQINTLVHDISIEQATDPEFAINFLAENMANGKAPQMWYTCFKKANS